VEATTDEDAVTVHWEDVAVDQGRSAKIWERRGDVRLPNLYWKPLFPPQLAVFFFLSSYARMLMKGGGEQGG
jgi:hypothetical protein